MKSIWLCYVECGNERTDPSLHVTQAQLDALGAALNFRLFFIPRLCTSIALTLAGDSYPSLSQSPSCCI